MENMRKTWTLVVSICGGDGGCDIIHLRGTKDEALTYMRELMYEDARAEYRAYSDDDFAISYPKADDSSAHGSNQYDGYRVDYTLELFDENRVINLNGKVRVAS